VRSFALVVGLAAVVGCGSSSSSSDLKALCKQSCDKGNTCFPGLIDVPMCKASCDTDTPTNCTNASAIASAANSCLSMSCDQLIACSQNIPDCMTGSGGSGGGSGGSGGSGGASGGSSGNTDGGGN
jgi:hypothetical protein